MTQSIMPAKFADRLRKVRDDRKMSQSELARDSGLQPSAISHFEAGRRKPSFENLRALVKALHVPADYLLGIKSESGERSHDTPNA